MLPGELDTSESRIPPRSVRTWLVWLVLACLSPGIVGALLLFGYEYRNAHDRLEQNTILTARALVQTLDSQLLKAEAIAQTLSTASSLDRGDFANFHRRARETQALVGAGANFILIDENGQQVINTLREYGEPLPPHGNPDQVRQVIATGRPVISDLFVSGLLHRPSVSVDVPVVQNGRVAYVLSAGMRPEQFNAILQAQGLPPDWVAGIFDSTGTIVARTHSPERFVGEKGSAEFVKQMRESREGAMETTTREGIRVFSVYSRSSFSDWTVGIGIPRRSLDAVLGRSLSFLALGVVALFGIGLGLARFMGGKIARSISSLTASAVALGDGDAVSVSPLHIREAAEVARAMGRAAGMLKERTRALLESNQSLLAREAELKESRARLVAILDSLTEGVIISDLAGNLLNMNPVARQLHGFMDVTEVRRRLPEFTELFELRTTEGRFLPLEEWPLAKVLRGESFADWELQVHRKDTGDLKVIGYSGTPVRDADGRAILGVLTIRDVSERKRVEERIQQLNAELEHRVRQRTAELERSNEALLRSNMELRGFAHAAAHDLQTPLRSIAGFARLLQREMDSCIDPRTDEWLNLVIDNTKRLQLLIQELLDYSRLDVQGRPFEATDMKEVFDQVVSTLAVPIAETGSEVSRGELPTVTADRIQIAQLLQNLIENGMKYNQSRPPRISVTSERRDGEWVVAVSDNGIGIDAKHHRRIFEIFRRLHTYGAIPGTGIGLAICQRIVERHGGRIWVESAPGQGSTFFFTLPDEKPGS